MPLFLGVMTLSVQNVPFTQKARNLHSLAVCDLTPVPSVCYGYVFIPTLCLKHNKTPQPYLKRTASATKHNSLKQHFKQLCHTKTVCNREILITHVNADWKNTWETQISFRITKIIFTSEISHTVKTPLTRKPQYYIST
jgi:hypothetical protein